ncbi:hypothetical protein [Peribacillus sp. SCS-155]|uniref:hypothetical protein n=1 Tax=Peribacillus sedimenti TaxID=3115297 RepID=UPI0039058EAD
MKKFFTILLVSIMVFGFMLEQTNVIVAAKTPTFSTKVTAAKKFVTLEKVLVNAKWQQVEYDQEGKNLRFFAFKKVNYYGGLSTAVAVLRSQKIGGYYIDVTIANPRDKDVLEVAKRSLQLAGVPVSAKTFWAVVNKAKSTGHAQLVRWGRYEFRVTPVDGGLYITETEHNHF